jgi:hypothetical protein
MSADENASHDSPLPHSTASETAAGHAEFEQMHVRVIALENLVIALLATATDHQLECAREMAAYIAPRPGSTPHPLTIRASAEMVSMVDRAMHFRNTPPDATAADLGA